MALSAAEVKILLSAQDSASAAIGKVEKSLGGLEGVGKKVGGAMADVGKVMAVGLVAGAAGVAAGLAGSVTAAAGFEKTMSGVKAVSGATGEEMTQLSGLALQLGRDTSFSASEAASGIEELVKGGLTIPDIMNGAAQSTLDLAAAGGVSLPEAATIAANALAQFNLKGEDMAHVADLIAGAANASALDVGQFRQSLQAGGAVAAAVGFSFDDLAQAIAVMGKAGITGSDAGTSLKTMMLNLQPTTDKQISLFKELGLLTEEGGNAFFDASGKVKSMAQVAQTLQDALGGMTEQQKLATLETIFGSDAIRAGAVLAKEGAAGFEEMATSMGKVTAKEVGAERLNNLAGSLEQLKGSIETAAITIGIAFLPAIRQIVDAVTAMVNENLPQIQAFAEQAAAAFTAAIPQITAAFQAALPVITAFFSFLVEHAGTIAIVVAAFAAFSVVVTVVGWITGAIAAFSALASAISAAGGVIGAIVAVLGGPVTIAIGLIIAAVALLAVAWSENWGDIQGTTQAVVDFIAGIPDAVVGAFDAIGQGAANLGAVIQAASDAMISALNDFSAFLGSVPGAAWDALVGVVQAALDAILSAVQTVWGQIPADIQSDLALIASHISGMFAGYVATVTGALASMQGAIAGAWSAIVGVISGHLATIQSSVSSTWSAISSAISGTLATIQGAISGAWASVASGTASTWNGVVSTIRGAASGVLSAIQSMASSVAGALASLAGSVGGQAVAIGNAIIQGIQSGITGAAGALAASAAAAVRGALAAAKQALDIRSPSRVAAAEVGTPVVEGVIAGIEAQERELAAVMARIVSLPRLNVPSFGVETAGTTAPSSRAPMPMYSGEGGAPAPTLMGGSTETNHYHFNGMTSQEVVDQVRALERRRQWHLRGGRRN